MQGQACRHTMHTHSAWCNHDEYKESQLHFKGSSFFHSCALPAATIWWWLLFRGAASIQISMVCRFCYLKSPVMPCILTFLKCRFYLYFIPPIPTMFSFPLFAFTPSPLLAFPMFHSSPSLCPQTHTHEGGFPGKNGDDYVSCNSIVIY